MIDADAENDGRVGVEDPRKLFLALCICLWLISNKGPIEYTLNSSVWVMDRLGQFGCVIGIHL